MQKEKEAVHQQAPSRLMLAYTKENIYEDLLDCIFVIAFAIKVGRRILKW